ncbi:MAG: nucleotidyltransferase family protein [Candidatus Omnitrophota bacterium]
MQAIILAGGKGERLKSITRDIPKPIIPLGGKPFCLYQIELLKKHGVRDIIFSIGYLREKVQRLLGNGSDLGIDIHYAIEDEPLGTAGAIKNSAQYLHSDALFLVLNGDVLTDMDLSKLIEFHRSKKSFVTISLIEAKEKKSYGSVLVNKNGRIKSFAEKVESLQNSQFVNAGIYVFERRALDKIPPALNYSFEKEFIPRLVRKNLPVFGFKTSCYWIDIGEPSRFKQAEKEISRLHPELRK